MRKLILGLGFFTSLACYGIDCTKVRTLDLVNALLESSEERVRSILACSSVNVNVNGEVEDGYRQTPLTAAAYSCLPDFARVLIEKGANVNQKTSDIFMTPLVRATTRECLPVMKVLIENKADASATGGGYTPLGVAVHKSLELVEYLVDHGADVNQPYYTADIPQTSPLHGAVRANKTEIVRYLLSKGADAKYTDTGSKTALDWATEISASEEILNLLGYQQAL